MASSHSNSVPRQNRLLGSVTRCVGQLGAVTRGPSVWTGRALQAENDEWEKVGLALLYPAY